MSTLGWILLIVGVGVIALLAFIFGPSDLDPPDGDDWDDHE